MRGIADWCFRDAEFGTRWGLKLEVIALSSGRSVKLFLHRWALQRFELLGKAHIQKVRQLLFPTLEWLPGFWL